MNAQAANSFEIPGLTGPVEILVDRWGVPHLYADSQDDLFLAQGFNAARDRLFQLDLWRRRGLGLLSEVFGGQYVEHDRAARLFLYRGDMVEEWSAYGEDTERITTAFVNGINAYVSLCRSDPSRLPPEFATLGHEPAYWDPRTPPGSAATASSTTSTTRSPAPSPCAITEPASRICADAANPPRTTSPSPRAST